MSVQKCETNVLGHFNFNYVHILIDEIALEGLEGIGIFALWNRVEHRISAALTEKMKCRCWETIVNLKDISLYQLPEPLPRVEIIDRFTLVDEETGDLKDPDDYLDGPYEYCPILNEYGSSKHYHTRKAVSKEMLQQVPYHQVIAGYGDTLVLVASIERRWQALASHLPIVYLQQLTPVQYCLLELIGKARENGQMTTGKTNLTNVIKEPKMLFYVRKALKDLDLVKVLCVTQSLASRGIKSILIRLNRFYQPVILSIPKIGKTHKIVEYLKSQPGYSESTEFLLQNGFLTHLHLKRLKKRNNVFEFEDERELKDEPPRKKSKSNFPKKRKCMFISTKSDESSQSEDEKEPTEGPVKYQYKLGVGLMRQAYERVLEAGLKGLSQGELCQMLGLEFYTCRLVFRIFKAKKIVREFFQERGKQRVSRFVAVAAGHVDAKYVEEKRKFLEYINQSNTSIDTQSASTSESITTNEVSEEVQKIIEMGKNHITEVLATSEENQDIQSIKESKKNLTLRQLKFGNGIIKIVNEKQCVTGFMTLSNLVAKEINDTPMVTKCLKRFLQKLVAAGQIKIYKVRSPGAGHEDNVLNLICAPHIKATDHIIQTKYKEVHVRAMARRPPAKIEPGEPNIKPLAMFINPRYMKIQKLHEAIIQMAYFEKIERHPNQLPEGFLSVTDMMPEMTVKFAISNISSSGLSEISHLKIHENYFDLKLKDAPPDIAHGLIKCKSLKNSLRLNLKSLAMFGLIQLIYQPENHIQTADYFNNRLASFLFYVNRNAKIMNTTGKWPREVKDIKSLERVYRFETFEDVKQYWSDVYDISVNTKITIVENRMKKTLNPPVRREQTVESFDNGERFGDERGPCGFDSCFYLDIARLWQTFYVREPKGATTKKRQHIKKPKQAKSKTPKKPAKKKAPKVNPVMKIKNVKKGRKRIPESTITWTPEEDRILILCQVAITIASPSSQPGCLRVRNIIAKDILSLKDTNKTQSICHRRALMLNQNLSLMLEKDSLLNEMRRRRNLIQKYEGLIKRLRLRYSTNMAKFINVARVPMLELVWLIWQVSISESYNQKLSCVAMDLKTFLENYNIVPATVNKIYNLYKEPDLALLRESVFLIIMLTLNQEIKTDTAKKIHLIFKTFPENSLRIVIDQLRRCGAVSAKEKLFNNQMHRLYLEDLAQSAYKVSAIYQRRWISRLNSEFADSLAKAIRADLPSHNIKGSAELNCMFSELQASNVLDIRTAVKPEIVDASGLPTILDDSINAIEVESKHRLKSGSITWENNPKVTWNARNVASLYPIPDFDILLQDMAKNATVTIGEQNYDFSNAIINFLNEKGESGCTFEELEKVSGFKGTNLAKKLSKLESEHIVKRVGLNNNVLILVKFINNWAMKFNNKYIMITPWLNLDFAIRCDVFLEWTSVIVNKIFELPGCSVSFLSDTFELITPRAVQDACMFLEKCNIITLQIGVSKECSLFSDDDEMPEVKEFHPYESVENIKAYPIENTITKYVYFKKVMLEKYSVKGLKV